MFLKLISFFLQLCRIRERQRPENSLLRSSTPASSRASVSPAWPMYVFLPPFLRLAHHPVLSDPARPPAKGPPGSFSISWTATLPAGERVLTGAVLRVATARVERATERATASGALDAGNTTTTEPGIAPRRAVDLPLMTTHLLVAVTKTLTARLPPDPYAGGRPLYERPPSSSRVSPRDERDFPPRDGGYPRENGYPRGSTTAAIKHCPTRPCPPFWDISSTPKRLLWTALG